MLNKYLKNFWRTFTHPRVFIFITIGTAVIFLTFCTENNALEIAISSFASVFIGLGVNNFTSLETHQKDVSQVKSSVRNALLVLEMADNKFEKLQKILNKNPDTQPAEELKELNQILNLLKQLLQTEQEMN